VFGQVARGNPQGLGPGVISAIPYITLISLNVGSQVKNAVGMRDELTSCKRCESAAGSHHWTHRESCLHTELIGLPQSETRIWDLTVVWSS
jgi:hypothetical protein